MDDLVSEFVIEAADSLAGLQSALAALSKGDEHADAAASMLRRMHGLKGLFGFAGFARAEAIAHAAEGLLQAVAASGKPASWRDLSLLADSLQRLAELGGAAGPGLSEPEGDDNDFLTGLELAAAAIRGEAGLVSGSLPAPAAPVGLPSGERRARAPWIGLDRLARSLGDRLGKRIDLMIGGDELRVARDVIPPLRTVLIALVRNACDHGVEPPDERRAAGKPGGARLQLTVRRTEDGFAIELADDGRGVDPGRVAARAAAQGIAAADALAQMDVHALQALVFEPGLTTAERLTAISGRGVGLDLVRREVEHLGGRITMASVPGSGTRFTIDLPVSALAQPASRRLAAA
jgi:two-component system chemotaxis sensor kinase CheA